MNRFSLAILTSLTQTLICQPISLPCGNAALHEINHQTIHVESMRETCDNGEIFIVRSNAALPQAGIEEVCFDLLKFDDQVHIYAERPEFQSGNISMAAAEILYEYFIDHTRNGLEPSFRNGIKSGIELLGNPPNVAGSGIVNILLMDIRDQFSATGNYIAGYFDPEDQTNPAFNGKDIVYLDSNPVNLSFEITNESLFTLAHEYQHLVHYASDPQENVLPNGVSNPWLNEGISDLLPFLMGLGHRDFGSYFNNTLIGLDEWISGEVRSYGKSALFTHFLYELFGFEFIQMIFKDNVLQRLDSIEEELNQIGVSFESVFYDWIDAIAMNEFELLDCILPQISQFDLADCLNQNDDSICRLNLEFPNYSFMQIRKPEFIENVTYHLPQEIYAQEFFNMPKLLFNNDKIILSNDDRTIFLSGEISAFNTSDVVGLYLEDEPGNYLTIGNSNWYGMQKIFIEKKSILSSISVKVGDNTPISVSVHTQDYVNVPKMITEICEPVSQGITRLELLHYNFQLFPGFLFVKVELNKNQLSYFSESGDVISYYSVDGSSYNNLSGLQIDGSSLNGSWGIGVEIIEFDFLSVKDTMKIISNYPNPYLTEKHNNGIIVNYFLEKQGDATLSVFDVNGRLITDICSRFSHEYYLESCWWNGLDERGRNISSGTYFLRLNGEGFNEITKQTLIR